MRRGVEPEVVAQDAEALDRAGRLLSRVRVGAVLEPLASFVPGGRTARCLGASRTDWDLEVTSVVRELGGLAAGLAAAAGGYAEVEAVAARHLGGAK